MPKQEPIFVIPVLHITHNLRCLWRKEKLSHIKYFVWTMLHTLACVLLLLKLIHQYCTQDQRILWCDRVHKKEITRAHHWMHQFYKLVNAKGSRPPRNIWLVNHPFFLMDTIQFYNENGIDRPLNICRFYALWSFIAESTCCAASEDSIFIFSIVLTTTSGEKKSIMFF